MQVTFYPCTLYQIESSHKNEFSDFLTDLYNIIKFNTNLYYKIRLLSLAVSLAPTQTNEETNS